MKANELRNLDTEQLESKVNVLRKDIFQFRNKASLGQLNKTHEIKRAKRELATVFTVLNEKKSAGVK